ncbi:hypothetical protein ACFGVR_06210 [Mucilaginibacter sp. AW1-3]
MQDKLSRGTTIRLKILGWYQIIGGIAGLILTIWLLVRTETITGLIALLFLTAFGLYVFSIYCGKLLLGNGYNKGLSLSNVNQALQIVNFLFLGYGFMYISGVMLIGSIKYGGGFSMGFNFGFNSIWQFSIHSDDRSFALGVNFVAIYLLFFVANLRERIAGDKQDQAVTETEDAAADTDPDL